MADFEYNYEGTPDSSLVEEYFYNEAVGQLAVNLGNGYYVYSGISDSSFDEFAGAESKGQAFQKIKREYGPGLFYPYGSVVFNYKAPLATAPAPGIVPKNLTEARPVHEVTDAPSKIDLAPYKEVANEGILRHTVRFNSGVEAKSDVHANSVEEAIKTVTNITSSLGVNIKITSVEVHFE